MCDKKCDNPQGEMKTDFQKAVEEAMHRMLHMWRLHGHALDKETMHQGIYKSQLKMLSHVLHHEGISQRELAQQLEISPPSIAVTAKRLEKMGYIHRKMDEKDNRMNILTITPEGREILSRTWKGFSGVDERMFEGFTVDEVLTLKEGFERMEENLRRIIEESDADKECGSDENSCTKNKN